MRSVLWAGFLLSSEGDQLLNVVMGHLLKPSRALSGGVANPLDAHYQKHENVNVRFLSSQYDFVMKGEVLVRPGEMVVDIPSTFDTSAYVIVGDWHDTEYRGRNLDAEKSQEVEAVWAKVGRYHIGTWIESGEEYVFFFELSKTGNLSPPSTPSGRKSSSDSMRQLMKRMNDLDKKIARKKNLKKRKVAKPRKQQPKRHTKDPPRAKTAMEMLSEELKRAVAKESTPTKRIVVYAPK